MNNTFFNDKNPSLAKPRYETVRKFSTGQLKMNASTFDFLMSITPYVDLDLRINIPFLSISQALKHQHHTHHRVIFEAVKLGYLVKRNGHYYSMFHVVTNGNERYLKPLDVFFSSTVHNYKLNTKRLFYYFATFAFLGDPKPVYVENLYKNSLNDRGEGMTYFQSYKEFANSFFELLQDGMIQVRLNNEEKTLLTKESDLLRWVFHDYCDYDYFNKRKERTSLLKKIRHKIIVNISPEIITERKIEASMYEFDSLADHVCGISDEQKYMFISKKNELFQAFGKLGLEIYRNTLASYLSQNESHVYRYAANNKIVNYYMDFYVLEAIKGIIADGAKLYSVNPRFSQLKVCGGYLVTNKQIDTAIRYFLQNCSNDHIVILDEILDTHSAILNELATRHRSWEALSAHTSHIFSEMKAKVDVPFGKEFVRKLAHKGILQREKELKEELQAIHNDMFEIPFKKVAVNMALAPDPQVSKLQDNKERYEKNKNVYYNWLEE